MCWIAAVAILAGTAAAGAQERLTMRYACSVAGGRILVEPSAERTYAIAGRHEQETFTACARPNARHCRTWMLHRFDLECDGGRVPWHAVVAAAPPIRGWDMWAENGRLHVRRDNHRFGARDRSCFGLPWRGPGERFEAFADWSNCPSYRPRHNAVHVLPAGFAPLVHLSARVMTVAPPPLRPEEPQPDAISVPVPRLVSGGTQKQQPLEQPQREQRQAAAPAKDAAASAPRAPPPKQVKPDREVKQAKPDPEVTSRPRLEAGAKPSEIRHAAEMETQQAAAASWHERTRIEPSSVDEHAGVDDSTWGALAANAIRYAPAISAAVAVLLSLLLAAFTWRWLRPRPVPAGMGLDEAYEPSLGPVHADAPTRAEVEDLMRNADDFHVHVVGLAARMRNNDALRDVVTDELAAIQASLRAPALAFAYAEEDWGTLRRSAVQVLTDLERIRRIVQSAGETAAAATAASSAPVRPAHAMPTTREEALAVLGVNADASEKVIKKIVDAMRQTWHPDLARNDIDRRTREERMKQINIAWDMLRTRRQAA